MRSTQCSVKALSLITTPAKISLRPATLLDKLGQFLHVQSGQVRAPADQCPARRSPMQHSQPLSCSATLHQGHSTYTVGSLSLRPEEHLCLGCASTAATQAAQRAVPVNLCQSTQAIIEAPLPLLSVARSRPLPWVPRAVPRFAVPAAVAVAHARVSISP